MKKLSFKDTKALFKKAVIAEVEKYHKSKLEYLPELYRVVEIKDHELYLQNLYRDFDFVKCLLDLDSLLYEVFDKYASEFILNVFSCDASISEND
jgi:hypothetical protein